MVFDCYNWSCFNGVSGVGMYHISTIMYVLALDQL